MPTAAQKTKAGSVKNRGRKWLVALLIALCAAIFLSANAHLVYVAFTSQPDCVDHARVGEAKPGRPVAAKSSC